MSKIIRSAVVMAPVLLALVACSGADDAGDPAAAVTEQEIEADKTGGAVKVKASEQTRAKLGVKTWQLRFSNKSPTFMATSIVGVDGSGRDLYRMRIDVSIDEPSRPGTELRVTKIDVGIKKGKGAEQTASLVPREKSFVVERTSVTPELGAVFEPFAKDVNKAFGNTDSAAKTDTGCVSAWFGGAVATIGAGVGGAAAAGGAVACVASVGCVVGVAIVGAGAAVYAYFTCYPHRPDGEGCSYSEQCASSICDSVGGNEFRCLSPNGEPDVSLRPKLEKEGCYKSRAAATLACVYGPDPAFKTAQTNGELPPSDKGACRVLCERQGKDWDCRARDNTGKCHKGNYHMQCYCLEGAAY